MKASLSIYRLNPDADNVARYDKFEIEIEREETVLAALKMVYEKLDSTLSFRFACGNLKCGECGIVVNKVPCLACEKIVEPVMKIGPLPHLPILKDLVVDRREVIDAIFNIAPILGDACVLMRTGKELAATDLDKYIKQTSCLQCLLCQSSCPVVSKEFNRFVGPLGLLWISQLELLDRSEQAELDQYCEMCTSCGKCWNACPSKVNFLEDAIKGFSR